jgi:hypothetical protein
MLAGLAVRLAADCRSQPDPFNGQPGDCSPWLQHVSLNGKRKGQDYQDDWTVRQVCTGGNSFLCAYALRQKLWLINPDGTFTPINAYWRFPPNLACLTDADYDWGWLDWGVLAAGNYRLELSGWDNFGGIIGELLLEKAFDFTM